MGLCLEQTEQTYYVDPQLGYFLYVRKYCLSGIGSSVSFCLALISQPRQLFKHNAHDQHRCAKCRHIRNGPGVKRSRDSQQLWQKQGEGHTQDKIPEQGQHHG